MNQFTERLCELLAMKDLDLDKAYVLCQQMHEFEDNGGKLTKLADKLWEDLVLIIARRGAGNVAGGISNPITEEVVSWREL